MNRIVSILKNNKITVAGIILGALSGLAYWKFVGCLSGTCPITSSPILSTLYGALMGGLIFSLFKKKEKQA